ncbi:MAG: peptide ABC transporter substrate-binding protein [Spirochaetales bacterium]|nr:MAG: peptide ABC transporter substrate-binding protein [Spirochaetales bacterium]
MILILPLTSFMKRVLMLFVFLSLILTLASPRETERELVVCFSSAEIGFNPLHAFTATEAQIYTALYEGLVTYNPYSLEPVPAAARTWDMSPDKKTYRFYIRQNARYWDGTPVRAQDFKDTWFSLLDPEEKAEYSFLFDIVKGARDYRLGVSSDPGLVGIRVISDAVLEVELENPSPHFLKILCHHSFVPIHPAMLHKTNWTIYNSIPGNGPFYIYRRTAEEMVLLKNQLYWDAGKISLSGIRVLFNDDPADVTSRFNEGEIHWAADGLQFSLVEDNNAISANALFATSYFFFSNRRKEFKNPAVRRGLSLLFPWKEIRGTQYNFMPTETLVPQIPYYPKAEGLGQNTEEGLRLLSEAGFPAGKGLPGIVIAVPENTESLRIAGLMAESLKSSLECEVAVETVPYAGYFELLKGDRYTLGTITWIGDFADPLTFLSMWTAESNLNDAAFNDPGYDAILAESMTLEGEDRYKKMSDAEAKLLREAEVLPVSHSPAFNLIDLDRIGGWFPNPLDIHPFKFISFKQPRVKPGIVKY